MVMQNQHITYEKQTVIKHFTPKTTVSSDVYCARAKLPTLAVTPHVLFDRPHPL